MAFSLYVVETAGLKSWEDDEDAYYTDFRFGGHLGPNNAGMEQLVRAMAERDLLDETVPEPGADAWPSRPDTGDEEADERAFHAACGPLLRRRSADPGRIPAYKFGSCDGWLIDPEECRLIAGRLAESTDPYARRFAAYAHFASTRGGFTVN